MRKTAINDVTDFIWRFVTIILHLIAMQFYLSNEINSKRPIVWIIICIAIFWGTITIYCIVSLIIDLEILTFHKDKLVSLKISSRIEIFYSEIKEIRETEKSGLGITGFRSTWEIADGEGKAIYVIRTKGRKKIIEELKEKIKKQELS